MKLLRLYSVPCEENSFVIILADPYVSRVIHLSIHLCDKRNYIGSQNIRFFFAHLVRWKLSRINKNRVLFLSERFKFHFYFLCSHKSLYVSDDIIKSKFSKIKVFDRNNHRFFYLTFYLSVGRM